ncbi:MAG: hypothetical protein Q8K64_01995, partial [Sediminibacterium sp.]|nr:hypothetical protein [Sediminibacterium sp.]
MRQLVQYREWGVAYLVALKWRHQLHTVVRLQLPFYLALFFGKPITMNAQADSIPKPFKPIERILNEVVVTGTLKEVRKSESPVSVEVYSNSFFKK